MADLDHQYIATLVDFSRRGDSDAFAELYMATCQEQYHFAYGYLKEEKTARDALRDTYIFALKNISALADVNLFLSWLGQIMLRTCLNLQAAREPSAKTRNPEDTVVQIEGQDFILRQILSLPFTESQVLILKYYSKLKIREIARLMNMKSSQVKHYADSGSKKLLQLSRS